MVAAQNGHTEVARLLIDARANIDLQDEVRIISAYIQSKYDVLTRA